MQYLKKIILIVIVTALVYVHSLYYNTEYGILYSAIALILTSLLFFLDLFIRVRTEKLFFVSTGGFLGLGAGFLLQRVVQSVAPGLNFPLILLYILPVVFFGYVGSTITGVLVQKLFNGNRFEVGDEEQQNREKILDTSVIIDGRILDIAETHFIDGPFIIPNFVLREIQLISDSSDPIKRNRGRRGLEMLNKLQQHGTVKVKISYVDYTDTREVDAKLVKLAMETGARLVTNDFNLNKVAELQGVKVLNLNNLTNALKPVVLPGEDILIDVIKEGKDENQGIGYLEDGTMVVIENGGTLLGKKVKVNVTSIIQTAAGKMIFTRAGGVADEDEFTGRNDRDTSSRGRNGGGRRGRNIHRGRNGDDNKERENSHGRGSRKR